MQLTLGQLAEKVGAQLQGNADTEIRGVAGIREAQEGDITFLANPKYLTYLYDTHASAVIASAGVETAGLPSLCTPDPSGVYVKVLRIFGRELKRPAAGIDPTAVVSPSARLGSNVAIGAHVVICDDVTVGAGTAIMAGSYLGYRSTIGEACWIHPNVVLGEGIEIGDRCIVHAGAVVGSDGFGFAQGRAGHEKIPQVGRVVIEEDVEIGANSTIDRATTGVTRVGRGTKIDNLVHVAHNVEIGEHSILCAQAGISGSTRLGRGVVLAGQAGLVGHIEIGDGAKVGAQGGVTKSIGAGDSVSGYPAMNHARAQRVYASMRNLPQALRTLREMERRVEELEKALAATQIENSSADPR